MLVTPACYSCIMHDLNGAIDLLDLSEEQKFQILDQSIALFKGGINRAQIPSYYITAVHRIVKQVSGISIPFEELRQKCNRVGMAVAERVQQKAAGLDLPERFRYLVQWTIAGNHLDFRTVGTGYDFDAASIEALLARQVEAGLQVDQVDQILEAVKNAQTVLFIHDNVGEIALDKLLIAEIRSYGAHVISALRGGPITSDATMEDGEVVGITEAADEVICAGPDTLGISLAEMSDELRQALDRADVVIAKGQANYYVFTEYVKQKPRATLVSLLSTKCLPVSSRFDFDKIINVATLLPHKP